MGDCGDWGGLSGGGEMSSGLHDRTDVPYRQDGAPLVDRTSHVVAYPRVAAVHVSPIATAVQYDIRSSMYGCSLAPSAPDANEPQDWTSVLEQPDGTNGNRRRAPVRSASAFTSSLMACCTTSQSSREYRKNVTSGCGKAVI